MEPVKGVVIGCGNRGNVVSRFSHLHPYELQIVGVADPDVERRAVLAERHQIPDEMQFDSWETLLNGPKIADVAIVTTNDDLHYPPARKALEVGYHVLLEKPMAPRPHECLDLADVAERENRLLGVVHSLRYTPFFQEIKRLLDSGAIGKLISIQHTENIGFSHFARSYVRGNWSNVAKSNPTLLSKSCHDIDVLYWLVGSECSRVSSFGSLAYFRKENAPAEVPLRCTDGCPIEPDCPYSALKIHLEQGTRWGPEPFKGTIEEAYKALHETPYSKCVYHCDNDAVDNQVVNLEFANGVTVSFTMCAFSAEITRTIKLFGSEGEIIGHMLKGEIEWTTFKNMKRDVIKVFGRGPHGGGDYALMREFAHKVRDGSGDLLTSGREAATTHLIAHAAEEARHTGTVVDVSEYINRIASGVRTAS